jgi:hypothetical protein
MRACRAERNKKPLQKNTTVLETSKTAASSSVNFLDITPACL